MQTTTRTRIVAVGQFLFRFRSYLPLVLLVGLTAAFWRHLPRMLRVDDYLWRTSAIAVAMAGVVLRCLTIGRIPRGTSGRNTRRQKADVLNTTGLYSIVRNPLYLANGLVWVGVTLMLEDWALTVLFVGLLTGYYAFVVFAEQEYLAAKFGDSYAAYAAATPAAIPRPALWKPSDRPFSWRMVLRREHDSVFSAVTGLVFVFQCRDVIMHHGRLLLRREWLIPWAVLAAAWLAVKVLKRSTDLLRVPRSV